MKRILGDYLPVLAISALVIAFDQWTKVLVRSHLAIQETWTPWPWLAPYARIVHWKNTGAAFGMLPGFSDVFTVLAILVSLAILYYIPRVPRDEWALRLAMGLQMGGALGNLIDRLTVGYVVDFVSVGRFPVFNVADASISTGVVVLILSVWLKERGLQAAQNQPPAGGDGEIPEDQLPGESRSG